MWFKKKTVKQANTHHKLNSRQDRKRHLHLIPLGHEMPKENAKKKIRKKTMNCL